MKNSIKLSAMLVPLIIFALAPKISANDKATATVKDLISTQPSIEKIDYSKVIIVAVAKADSPIWKGFQAWRGATKTNGLSGSKRQYYEWDNTHEDIEVYDSNGIHLGSMDATSGAMIKPAVAGRKIAL